ncbi:hypothetical protein K457DRAFT_127568 [Linnemannia elongata AG-77]|uniref:Major facilitator superfamily (MFS) profile domain-containing protein n=1 Tax=Linnemannia elongata AG-77 TaxID=1314771 RepID=A0A197JQG7_9FUNG|nr:hypothetical protein K457DRAFT_127568 [Linnemannia elongata AG-77]
MMVFGSAGCTGQTLGVLLGGIFDATIGWYWIFYITSIISALLCIAGFFVIAKANDDVHVTDRRVDFVGVISFMLGIIAVIYYLSESTTSGWGSAHTLAPFLVSVSSIIFAQIVPGTSYWHFAFPALIINCLGLSPTWMCCQVNAVADAPDEDQGVVGAVFNVAIQLGGPICLAISTILSQAYEPAAGAEGAALMFGYRAAFYTFGVIGGVG